MKKKTLLVIGLIIIILFAGTFSIGYFRLGFAIGQEVYAQNVHVNATLLENGDIQIEETTTFRYKDRDRDWWNFYRTFHWEEIEAITDISVYDHDYDKEYTFVNTYAPSYYPQSDTPFNICYLVDGDPSIVHMRENGLTEEQIREVIKEFKEEEIDYFNDPYWEIGFNFPPIEKGTRTFTLSYTLSGVAPIEKYADADVLYFKFVQEDTYPIRNFSMDLHFPNTGTDDDLTAWLHCAAPGTLTIQDDETLTVTADHIPGDVFLEVRLLMPSGSLQGTRQQHASPIRDEIVREEDAWAATWFDAQRYRWLTAFSAVLGGILLIIAAFGLAVLQEHIDKKTLPDVREAPYVRQLPYAVSPAVVGQFYRYTRKYREESKDPRQDMIAASTLNMAQKGWLLLSEENVPDLGVPQLFITPTQGHTPLTKEEQVLYNLFCTVAKARDGRFTPIQYAKYAKKEFYAVSAELDQYFKAAEHAFREQHWSIRLGFFTALCAWMCVLYLACAAALFFWLHFFGYSILIGGFCIGAIVLVFGALGRARLTPAGREAYVRWNGFRRYLKEFTLTDERSPHEVPLWNDYLVYGTVLGVGETVSNQLAHLAPKGLDEMNEAKVPAQMYPGILPGTVPVGADSYHSTSAGAGGGFAFGAVGGNIASLISDIHSIGQTLGTVERAVSAANSAGSGSSGGGSSSSSSGGGGGGGGGGSSGFR